MQFDDCTLGTLTGVCVCSFGVDFDFDLSVFVYQCLSCQLCFFSFQSHQAYQHRFEKSKEVV